MFVPFFSPFVCISFIWIDFTVGRVVRSLHGRGAAPVVVIKLLGRPDPVRELGLNSPMRRMCL